MTILLILLYVLVVTVQFVETGILFWMTFGDGVARKEGTELLAMAVGAMVSVGMMLWSLQVGMSAGRWGMAIGLSAGGAVAYALIAFLSFMFLAKVHWQ